MKTLVIAEKPSVAADLARVLKVPKKGDIYENDTHVISSAIGHLVELEMPEDIDPKLRFWRLESLPIVPKKFGLKASPKTKDRFFLLKKLLARPDISTAVNACDAGREGELIFAYIYQLAKAKVPVKRAWMQTMTAEGIRTAFDRLRDGPTMSGLEDAARCRSESDWLIGMNGTRALTKRMYGRAGSGNVATVGRVQTPTLAIVVNRELEIRNFVPRDYSRITADFQITNGSYEGTFQRPDYKKNPTDEHDRPDRLWDVPTAAAIATAARAATTATLSDEKKATTAAAPRLYDLTTLQREANSRYGLPARRTLQIAQALYERYKVITYPRTDSRALPEDYIPTCKQTLGNLHGDLSAHAAKALESGWVRPNKRIFNNAQISDHFAIIPTGTSPEKLDDMEAKIYDMIARRFVATFYPVAEYDVTTRTTTITPAKPLPALQFHAPKADTTAPLPPTVTLATLDFKSEGKVLTAPGWLAVYGKSAVDSFLGSPLPAAENNEDHSAPTATTSEKSKVKKEKEKSTTLPALAPADGTPPHARPTDVQLHKETTKPPPRYTEATLLSAMEGAGKLVDDEELADAMKERGLGTPATRAEIIEGLVYQNYLERGTKRDLLPTQKAESLLEFLAAVKADALTKPDMTGQWEYKLRQMEQGKYARATFMDEITTATCGIVERTKNFAEDDHDTRLTDIPSPTDNQPLIETLRAYKSQDGILTIYKVIAGRKLEESELRQLLTDGEIGPLDGFVSPRTGNRFPSKLKLANDEKNPGKKKVELDFGNKVDHSTLTSFWQDPKGKTELCEAPTNYILRQPDGTDYKELFKVGRLMCQKPITREQAIQLVTTGKTDLIQGFISKKGRPFDAYLLRQGARINWEFPPRAAKTGADGKPLAPRKGSAASVTAAELAKAENLGPAKLFPDATLYRTSTHYLLTKLSGDGSPWVVFKQAATLCGVDIPPAQIQLLLNEGRTELIPDMTSKGGRKFSAFLVLSKDKKKAEFEFPPR